METIHLLKKRRSIRTYSSKDIEEDSLREILMAGASAPSAHNKQPWSFIIIRDNVIQKQLMLDGSWREQLVMAPVVIAVCFDKNNEYASLDAALAAENMIIAATALGIGSCVLTSYYQSNEDKERYKELKSLLKLPDDIEALLLISLGYSDETPEDKKLKPLEELIHFEKYGGLQYLKDQ